MQQFHVVGGLPRSGSTLLCNILNQNPRIYVSSTSPFYPAIAAISSVWGICPEIKGMLVRDRPGTLERITLSAKRLAETWYGHIEKPIIVDKNRFWNYDAALINNVWPDAKVITIARDLRSIFASIEKRHVETAILNDAQNLASKTLLERAHIMFSVDGPIGKALMGMEDLIRRRPKNWHHLRYEDLCSDPKMYIDQIYDQIGENSYGHNFDNVENVAEDVDELYLLKFPHEGCGPVRKPVPEDWKEWVSDDIEDLIMNKFQLYNNFFGYQKGK